MECTPTLVKERTRALSVPLPLWTLSTRLTIRIEKATAITSTGGHWRTLHGIAKPRADLVQMYTNAMGVLQATGQQVFSQEERSAMMDWILGNEEADSAPVAVVEFLETFDPCDHAGVSKLW